MAPAWWKDLGHIRDGVGESVGHWFENNLRLAVGNGENTMFWKDRWLDDIPLSSRDV
ncbi:defensin/CCP-like protein [Trifolium medium]|uniref:Defensin/CCP-like protein n=1 Tax=Trifolium medium TaxID=97028 RepID=A0A392UDR5_9FABA|nr:defensin/CCP-like protein [Trifolium medium]